MWALRLLEMLVDPFKWSRSVSLVQKYKNTGGRYKLSLKLSFDIDFGKSHGEGKAPKKL
jgi:hypothetical protein